MVIGFLFGFESTLASWLVAGEGGLASEGGEEAMAEFTTVGMGEEYLKEGVL